ncbi:sugar fermentation stimulation protein [Marinithermofilum abyssi]|uniref:Sugar fermentation stimulation protein homolog n=1 Tax=Marinithermofilum abyssi TaxID=1571185 RepID=A0A8J2YCE2_9BACL|nr:DNA/RNA nuclease SfsA [Marinithermofilum abyssi]GGE07008.1 sugar fermentation stimulation protein [Marinithermofilum abyssi]
MAVHIEGETVHAIFLERPNRFEAIVQIGEKMERVHVPNTGRMQEMLHPGVPVVLEKSDNPRRKNRFSLKWVNKNGHWICIHSAWANRVFEDAVERGWIDWVKGPLRREVKVGESRVDFLAETEPPLLIEVKCVTYEENGRAMFPDAPTLRGQKHLDELIRATQSGYRAAVALMIFMDFPTSFTPHDGIDPVWGEKLREAKKAGVGIRAYTCRIGLDTIQVKEEVPVVL